MGGCVAAAGVGAGEGAEVGTVGAGEGAGVGGGGGVTGVVCPLTGVPPVAGVRPRPVSFVAS